MRLQFQHDGRRRDERAENERQEGGRAVADVEGGDVETAAAAGRLELDPVAAEQGALAATGAQAPEPGFNDAGLGQAQPPSTGAPQPPQT